MTRRRVLTAWTLAMINVAAICNIKNFPLMAEYGFSIITFLLLSSVFFFIPLSLVSAELASAWPKRGIHTWLNEAFGPKSAFLGVWLQWITNVIWYPTILSFLASSFAYIFFPELAQNKIFVLSAILITFWAATFVNSLGMEVSSWISSIGAVIGTILPVGMLILFGTIWLIMGHTPQIDISWKAVLPDLSSYRELVLLSGILLALCGMEMSAVHALDVQKPQKDYPKAIFLSAILILVLSIAGSVIIAAIVPKTSLELTSGGLEAFSSLLKAFNASWATPIVAAMVTIGGLGMLSTWIVGPSRSLFATSENKDLPAIFYKKNQKEMPIGIFVTQGIFVSILSLLFLYMPSVDSSYWILVVMSSELYMILYIMMFIAAIRLRYIHPNVHRAYSIPGKKIGMWFTASLGMLGALFAFVIGLFPPSQILVGDTLTYETILIGSILFFCLFPFFITWLEKSFRKT